MPLDPLHRRILELSYANGLSHIGSCISVVGILDRIYTARHPDEPVVLGAGHAGLALYCVLEKHHGVDPQALLDRHGIHATRDVAAGIYVSTGSLGQPETVAMGMALADRDRCVFLVSTDGGAAEGAFWETLMHKSIARVDNLCWSVNANGWAACRATPLRRLTESIAVWCPDVEVVHTDFAGIPFLNGLEAHYRPMTAADWAWVQAQDLEVAA